MCHTEKGKTRGLILATRARALHIRDQFGQAGRRCSVPIDSDSDSDRQEFYSTYARFEYMSKILVKNAIF